MFSQYLGLLENRKFGYQSSWLLIWWTQILIEDTLGYLEIQFFKNSKMQLSEWGGGLNVQRVSYYEITIIEKWWYTNYSCIFSWKPELNFWKFENSHSNIIEKIQRKHWNLKNLLDYLVKFNSFRSNFIKICFSVI
jgi:hypothetical protein